MNHSKWIILGLINYLHLKVGKLNDIQIKIYVNLLKSKYWRHKQKIFIKVLLQRMIKLTINVKELWNK